KPGLLQIADEGTLVIENIEHLTRNTQNLLADFIKTGSFLPLNTQTPILSSVRIMATCGENPENLIQKGQLQQELVKLFHEESLFLPPLRKRKKDLRLIVKHLIEKSNDLYGKNVQRLGQEAYQRIVSYDWPGNYEELATTIERGVKLAQGETLLSEDLFFGLKPLKGKLSFDILKLEPAQRIFKSKAYPRLAQAVSGLFLLGLVSLGFFGSRIPAGKFSLALTWGIWEPLVIVSALLLARIWCAACPVGGGCLYISRHFSLKKEVPLFIRRYGLYICAAGLIAIFWSQAAWNMYDSPRATAALVATIAGLGLVSGLIFHKLVWCRYLCPLGALVGLFARSSCTEMRSNVHVCNHECRDHTCLEDAEYNCPMLEAPFTQQSNQNCILCGNCVKACPNGSPNLNLRAPGYELSVVRYPIGFMNLFVPVLLGCQLFRATAQLDIPILEDSLSRIWLLWPGLLCLFLIFAYQYIQISGKRIFGDLIKPDINKGNLLNYALVPLLLGIELSFQLELMLVKNREFLLTLNEHFALIWKSLTFSFDPKIIIFYQLLLLAISSLAAALVLNKIALRHQSFRTGLSWRKRWPIFMLAAIFAWLSIAG
ncbi:MAG: sigma 54-interacting transcriptional regulator, partial [Desulfohalobiaceae bacterium]|nr:sigma 54-interacting transcriptional regulator [Desulfohalobiaceae bacterium]